MKPILDKVVIGNATLYLGDALIVLPQLDVAAEALIADPPYSSGGAVRGDRMQSTVSKYVQHDAKGAAHNQEFSGDNRDARSFKYWLSLVFLLAREQLRPGAYALCFSDWRQLPLATDAFQAGGLLWRGVIPWDKTESSRGPHTGYFRHQCEYVVWGSNGPLAKSTYGGPWAGCYRERVNPAKKLHMTGKPVELMTKLMQCVPLGGLIIDPCMGSASTGVAALEGGYSFIGIENTRRHFDVACERLEKIQRGLEAA